MQTSQSGKGPILVVEDDEDIRESLKDILCDEGHEILLASNGRQALDILANVSPLPSLIFLDLMMPEMTGMEFLDNQVHDERMASIPVVILSARLSDFTRKRSWPSVVKLLPKPVDLYEILELAESPHHQLAN